MLVQPCAPRSTLPSLSLLRGFRCLSRKMLLSFPESNPNNVMESARRHSATYTATSFFATTTVNLEILIPHKSIFSTLNLSVSKYATCSERFPLIPKCPSPVLQCIGCRSFSPNAWGERRNQQQAQRPLCKQ